MMHTIEMRLDAMIYECISSSLKIGSAIEKVMEGGIYIYLHTQSKVTLYYDTIVRPGVISKTMATTITTWGFQ
jgi:hypothetical protein